MIHIAVPDFGELELQYLVLDYNGTLAVDGVLIPGVREKLAEAAASLRIHVVTADTFGKVRSQLDGVDCQVVILEQENQAVAKQSYIRNLGARQVVAMGNGRNDRFMVKDAALGIAVIQEEGAAVETLLSADVAVPHVISAIDLLVNPLRLIATLRS